jgi:hypothetical protein
MILQKGGEMKKTIDSRKFRGVLVVLKYSDDQVAVEMGRSWYAVIGGKTHFPSKDAGIESEADARAWINLLCRRQNLLG